MCMTGHLFLQSLKIFPEMTSPEFYMDMWNHSFHKTTLQNKGAYYEWI